MKGVYPGGTNPAIIHLTGTIISWWARIEGVMIFDIWPLRSQAFSAEISANENFPTSGKDIIKQWRKLLVNAYGKEHSEVIKIEAAKSEALTLIDHRNSLVHSFWPYGQVDQQRLELHWVRRADRQPNGVSLGTYSKSIEELDEINDRLASLYTKVMAISFNSHRLYIEK